MADLVDLTKKIGLNEYEARAYLALAKLGSAPVSIISKSAAIPRARAYDVLISLENKGFVQKKPIRPLEYIALSPASAFKNLKRKKSEDFQSSIEELDSIQKSLERQLSISYSQPSSDEVLLVEGRANIYRRIAEYMEGSKESIIVSSSPKGIKRKTAAFSNKLDALSKKGVRISYRPSPNSRFIIFDKKSVLLFLNNEDVDEKQEKALIINSPFVVNSLTSLKRK